MTYKLYTTSVEAWDAMIEAIDLAQKSIFLEMYIFLDDTAQSHDFVGKLKQKAREGLRVVVVVDAFGSKLMKNEIAKNIQDSGVELIFFSHWMRHIHRKVLVIDEKTAFIGGVNIGKRFTHWKDLQLSMQGTVVKRIMKSFAYTYEMSGGKDKKILAYREKKFARKIKFLILEHWPIKNIYSLKSHYQEKLPHAQKSIRIVTPYFAPPRWLISLLDGAVQRGVEVEIIIPETSDLEIMNRVHYRYMHVVSKLGIKCYLSKTMNHSKLLLIDDEEALIGSQNMDLASFNFNAEVGVFFKEKKLVKQLSETFENWKQDTIKFKDKKYQLRFIDYTILILMKLLRPIL